MPEKVLYTAEATATGDGRNGHVTSADGRIDLDLALPPEMGGCGNISVELRLTGPAATTEQPA